MQEHDKGRGPNRGRLARGCRVSWYLALTAGLLALLLVGCSTNKEFETEILGHPAPEVPTDTSWPKNAPPPPPPATAPPAASGNQYQPKPFKPAATPPAGSAAPQQNAPMAPVSPVPTATMATAKVTPEPPIAPPPSLVEPGEKAVYTFQVGAYAHADNAKRLMTTLESRGFSTRMDQGTMNDRAYFRILAVKTGNRAELEGELLACGVTEPRLMDERPVTGAPRAAAKAPTTPAASATPTAPVKAKTKAGKTASTAKTAPAGAPPGVESAPPLPDGYVPPPGSSGN